MTGASVKARKDALRAAAHASRQPDRSRAARHALDRLLELAELGARRTVSLYASSGDEVPVETALVELRSRGHRTVLPRVEGCCLVLIEVGDPQELEIGFRGLREPRRGLPDVSPEQVDLFFVPGVLFDRLGRRLGRGGGHFDRLLARARADALRIGCSYSDRIVDELPVGRFDIPMHLVLTEGELIRVAVGC